MVAGPVAASSSAGGHPGSLAELPLRELGVFELLGFDRERRELDLGYAGYGWARPARVVLSGRGQRVEVPRPVVIALHAADDGPALAGDVLLELPVGADASVATPLSRLLAVWLPRLPSDGPVVLALCNPHRVTLPPLPGGRPLWYGLGAVDSWLDEPGLDRVLLGDEEHAAGGVFRLDAERWRRA